MTRPLLVFASWLVLAALVRGTSSEGPSLASGRFEDATGATGIDFVHQNSPTTSKYLIETMGSGCG